LSGKYRDGNKQGPVRIALRFQTVEIVNEGTEARLRSLELFASGRETGWRNRHFADLKALQGQNGLF
jgi:hypothetical protein